MVQSTSHYPEQPITASPGLGNPSAVTPTASPDTPKGPKLRRPSLFGLSGEQSAETSNLVLNPSATAVDAQISPEVHKTVGGLVPSRPGDTGAPISAVNPVFKIRGGSKSADTDPTPSLFAQPASSSSPPTPVQGGANPRPQSQPNSEINTAQDVKLPDDVFQPFVRNQNQDANGIGEGGNSRNGQSVGGQAGSQAESTTSDHRPGDYSDNIGDGGTHPIRQDDYGQGASSGGSAHGGSSQQAQNGVTGAGDIPNYGGAGLDRAETSAIQSGSLNSGDNSATSGQHGGSPTAGDFQGSTGHSPRTVNSSGGGSTGPGVNNNLARPNHDLGGADNQPQTEQENMFTGQAKAQSLAVDANTNTTVGTGSDRPGIMGTGSAVIEQNGGGGPFSGNGSLPGGARSPNGGFRFVPGSGFNEQGSSSPAVQVQGSIGEGVVSSGTQGIFKGGEMQDEGVGQLNKPGELALSSAHGPAEDKESQVVGSDLSPKEPDRSSPAFSSAASICSGQATASRLDNCIDPTRKIMTGENSNDFPLPTPRAATSGAPHHQRGEPRHQAPQGWYFDRWSDPYRGCTTNHTTKW